MQKKQIPFTFNYFIVSAVWKTYTKQNSTYNEAIAFFTVIQTWCTALEGPEPIW